jgi:hypothetical protein
LNTVTLENLMRIAQTLLVAALAIPAAGLAQELAPDAEPVETTIPVHAVSADAIAQARTLLSAYHALPTREQLEAALGAAAQGALWAIVRDEEGSALHRDRAVVALAAWPDDTLRQYLDEVLTTAGEDDMDRHRAITVYTRAFGDASLDVIAPLLAEGSLQVRLTAIDAVQGIGTPTARALLESVRPLQAERLALDHLDEALQSFELVTP